MYRELHDCSFFVPVVSKRLVDAHGGRLSAHSDGEGCGCRFRIELSGKLIFRSFTMSPSERIASSPLPLEQRDDWRMGSPIDSPLNRSARRLPPPEDVSSSRTYINSLKLPITNSIHRTTRVAESILDDLSERSNIDSMDESRRQHLYMPPTFSNSNIEIPDMISQEYSASNFKPVDKLKEYPVIESINSSFHALDVEVLDELESRKKSDRVTKIDSKISKKTFLVVEDSTFSRRMMRRLLESYFNCTCVDVSDGQEAVNAIKQMMYTGATYDLITIDYQMPNMDGPRAVKAVRDLGYEGVIVGLTGDTSQSSIEEFISHGANVVFTKPLDILGLETWLNNNQNH